MATFFDTFGIILLNFSFWPEACAGLTAERNPSEVGHLLTAEMFPVVGTESSAGAENEDEMVNWKKFKCHPEAAPTVQFSVYIQAELGTAPFSLKNFTFFSLKKQNWAIDRWCF